MLSLIAIALVTTSMDNEQAFPTRETAAKAALQAAVKVSGKMEYGGVIYEKGGSYFYTLPVTSNNAFYVNYRISIPVDGKLVALYHTHPNNTPYANRYSVADILTANKLQVSSYIGVVKGNRMLTYDPTKVTVNIVMKSATDIADYNPVTEEL